MATGTVTLEKSYFETLLRRAQFHTGGVDYTTPVHLPTVTIPKTDHDQLLDAAHHYANLRRNLFRGGIAEETLAVLIRDDASTSNGNSNTNYYANVEDNLEGGAGFAQPTPPPAYNGGGQDYTFGHDSNYTAGNDTHQRENNGFRNHTQPSDDYAFMPDGPDGFYEGASGNNDSQPRFTRQHYEKFAKRTVLLGNLPEGTTHSDIVEVVKGGMLLDIYLRTHDRAASVSFLEEAAAHEFFRHVKRYDLYVRGKRVQIRWNDRQFILPGHVASKIAIGATRNLVIQNCNSKHTEQAIRDDLEHIHNLVVVKVTFKGRNAYISTNSVHNAMFARTCMMSRATYKGSKIEWDNDECAAALDTPLQTRSVNIPPKKRQNGPLMNRFQLLNIDGTEDESEDVDEDNDISGLSNPTAFTATTTEIVT